MLWPNKRSLDEVGKMDVQSKETKKNQQEESVDEGDTFFLHLLFILPVLRNKLFMSYQPRRTFINSNQYPSTK